MMLHLDPPYSNTGVTTLTPIPLEAPVTLAYRPIREFDPFAKGSIKIIETNKPKFDWFSGMISSSDYDLISDLIGGFLTDYCCGFDYLHNTATQGRYLHKKMLHVQRNYKYALHYMAGTETLCSLSYGGSNHKYGLYLDVTGGSAHLIFDALRAFLQTKGLFLKASRVDVCVDYQGDYSKAFKSLKAMARHRNMKVNVIQSTDENGQNAGRTLYIDLKGGVIIRLYEKGLERALVGTQAPLDWIRFEMQVKVGSGVNRKLEKQILAKQSPAAILSLDEDAVQMINRITDLNLSHRPIRMTERSPVKTFEEKVKAMTDQYGDRLLEIFEDPEKFSHLVGSLYSDPDQIPTHLRPALFEHIESQLHLRHGEY